MLRLVAITQRVVVDAATGERRDALDQRWTGFLALAGLRPLILPNDPGAALELVRGLEPAGLVLTGGGDLLAHGGDAPERDKTEAELVDWATAAERPVLGVCRGMQLLLSLDGVALRREPGHVRARHRLDFLGRSVSVNSYHDWVARELGGSAYEALARAEDGVVEAVRHRVRPWIGIMWHPEREHPAAAHDMALFRDHFAPSRGSEQCAA